MNGLRLLAFLLLTTATLQLQAQQLSLFTQYREQASLINPAAIENDYLVYANNATVGVAYRAQWVGLANAPTTSIVRGSYIWDRGNVGLVMGGHIISDQTGPTGFTGIYGRFGGIISSDPEYGGLVLALSAGIVQYRVNASEITLRQSNDIVGTNDLTQWFPDVGVGLYYYQFLNGGGFDGDAIYMGVSVPQVAGLDFTFQDEDSGEFFQKRIQHFYGTFGLIKFFDNDSFIEPSLWVKYAPNAPSNVDLNLRYHLPSNIWIGTGVSTAKTFHFEAGFALGDNVGLNNTLKFGYGYDYSFSDFGPTAGSTHEIGLSLSFDD